MNLPGHAVNPASLSKGDVLADRVDFRTDPYTGDDIVVIRKSHKIGRAEVCPGKPEMIHLDGACYDTRFSTVYTTK